MKKLLGMSFLLAVLLLFAGRSSFAQDAGQIVGTVTDPTGAIVANAVITARNLGTNAVRTVTASDAGSYVITNLPPANYEVSTGPIEGFSAYHTQVEVTVGGKMTVDIKLSPVASTTVEVTSQGGVQVNTSTAELSQVVDRTQVAELPSLTRNPYDFVQLSGNISAGDSTANGASENTTLRGVGFNLNGQRSTGTEILLDGVENVAVFGDSVGISVPLDAVHEFSVITSNYEPQYGRASGGVVNVATNSGTNNFHGTLWEFNRLAAYTANTVTNAQQGVPKGGYTRNQFGFAVGGPAIKDKLFFFGSTEWVRVRSGANVSASVVTPQFLAYAAPNIQSYFSQFAGTQNFNFSSTTTAGQFNAQQLAAGKPPIFNNIPANTPVFGRVDYTVPSDAGGGLPQNTYNAMARLDYNLSNKTQVFFRYVDYNEIDATGSAFYSPYTQYDVGGSNKSQAYLLNLTHTFSPVVSTIGKLSFSRFNIANSYNTKLQNTPTLFVTSSAHNPFDSTEIRLPGFYDLNTGNGGLPFGGPQNTIQYNQDVMVVKGKHSAQAGAQILYIQENNAFGAYAQAVEEMGKNLNAGLAAFQTGNEYLFSAAVNPNGTLPCVRDPYTHALVQTASCSITLPASSPSFARSDRFHDWAVYAQDSWKATQKATINYGVRYEYFGVQHNDNPNLDSNFYYGPGTSYAQQVRTGHVLTTPKSPIGALWKPQYGTISPRLGFAYDVFGNGKTSFRGGYGISYERNFGNVTFNTIQNPPGYAVIVINNTTVTNSNAGPLGGSSGSVPLPPTSLRNVDENIRTAQTQFWDAAVEQQLAPSTVLGIQYSGARGVHLYDIKNINGLGSGNVLGGDPVTDPQGRVNPNTGKVYQSLTRLNPQFSDINNRGSNGDSYYEALNFQFQTTNFHHSGLSLVANYTLSHQMDDLSTTFSESDNVFILGYTNFTNPGLDRGPGDLDIRHRLVVAPIYKTPYPANKLLGELVGGWEVTGIYTARTGAPFTYFDSTNYGGSLMDLVRYTPAGGQVPQKSFTKIPKGQTGGGANSYVIGHLPPAYSFGNPALLGVSDWGPYPHNMTARNTFRGPGAWNLNATISKNFPIHEQVSVEFRAEGYDLLNHHNLYIVGYLNDVANDPSLPITAQKGGLGGPGDERRFGQFAAKIHF